MAFQMRRVLMSIFILHVVTAHNVEPQGSRRKRSDDLGLQPVVDQLAQELNSLKADVNALKTKTASLDKAVAFYAWSDSDPVTVAAHSNFILPHVTTNIGGGYNPSTGIFTVPVSGLYDFHASLMSQHLGSDEYARGAIFVDEKLESITISDSRHSYYDHCTMKAVLHVNAGQRVSFRNPDGRTNEYFERNDLPYTTFSGFLIKAD